MKHEHNRVALATMIKGVPDYRHKSAAQISAALGVGSERSMQRWIRELTKAGLLPPRSMLTLDGVQVIRQVQRYLGARPGIIHLGELVRAIDRLGNNYSWVRWLLERAVAEGHPIDLARICLEPVPKARRACRRPLEQGGLRFVTMTEVDDDHRRDWIALLQSWYRLVPRQEVSDAA